jgi:hypothetical protein
VFVLAYASGERQFNGRKKRDVFGSERRHVGLMQSEPFIASERGQDSNVSDARCSRVQQRRSDCQVEQGSGIMGGVFWDGTPKEPVAKKEALAYTQGERQQQGQDAIGAGQDVRPELGRSEWWAVEPDVGRVAHGVPARVDRLKGLGNAVVPQVAELVGKMVLQRLGSTGGARDD